MAGELELCQRLLDFTYLQTKLDASDLDTLIAECEQCFEQPEVQLVMSTLTMSRQILEDDKTQLANQIIGRLGRYAKHNLAIRDLVLAAYQYQTPQPALKLVSPTLQSAGAIHLQTLQANPRDYSIFAVDGDYLAYLKSFDTIHIVNWRTGVLYREIVDEDADDNHVAPLALTATHVFRGGYSEPHKSGVIRAWDWHTGIKIHEILDHRGGMVISMVVSGERIISLWGDCYVKVWDWHTGELQNIGKHEASDNSGSILTPHVAVSDAILASFWGKIVKIWNWHTGELLQTLIMDNIVDALALSGNYVLVGSNSHLVVLAGDVLVYDWRTGKELRRISGGNSVDYISIKDQFAVVCEQDHGGIRVVNWQTGEHIRTIRPTFARKKYSRHTAISDNYVLMAFQHGDIEAWQWQAPEIMANSSNRWHSVNAIIAFDDHVIVAANVKNGFWITDYEPVIEIWDAHKGQVIRSLQAHTQHILDLQVQDNYLLSASADSTIKLWNWQTGEQLRTFEGHTGAVRQIIVSNQYLISAGDDAIIRVWNWQSGSLLQQLEGHTGQISKLALSGDYLLSVQERGDALKVWQWRTGQLVQTIKSGKAWDRNIVLLGEYVIELFNTKMRVWHWVHATELIAPRDIFAPIIEFHEKYHPYSENFGIWNWQTILHKLDFTEPDLGLPITGYMLGTFAENLIIWDVESGEPLIQFIADYPLTQCAISPNEKYIAVGGQDGKLHFLRTNKALRRILVGSMP